MNGTLLWEKDLGDKRMRNQFGEGSTPALHGNTLVIVWDHLNGDGSFVVALDKRDGKELWRVPREEIDTWATPLILEVNGRAQAIVPAMNRIRGYDLETGSVVWEGDGLTMNPIPSPVYDDGLVILMSGFQGNDLRAVRVAEASGNIDGTSAVAWSLDRDTPYVPSPIVADGVLYFLKTNSGILSAFDAKTGKPHYQNQRLDGAAERLLVAGRRARDASTSPGREGTTLVIRSGPTFEVLAKNTLDDGFDASPALVDNEIYMRGYKHLYAIAYEPFVRHEARREKRLRARLAVRHVWSGSSSSATAARSASVLPANSSSARTSCARRSMMCPRWKLSAPTTCVARSTARCAADVAASFASDASASDGVAGGGRLPRHQHRGVELGGRIRQQSLDRLLARRRGMRGAGRRERFAQRAPADAEAGRRHEDPDARHDGQRRANRLCTPRRRRSTCPQTSPAERRPSSRAPP